MNTLDYEKIDTEIKTSLQSLTPSAFSAKNYDRADNVHRLFQYPARMVPETQELILNEVVKHLPEESWVLDPFMGSATSLVTTMNFGLNVVGQDINPLAILLSKVKTGPFRYDFFMKDFFYILQTVEEDSRTEIDIDFTGINKWFKPEVQVDLSKLRRAIMSMPSISSRRFFWIVLAETIRLTSNDRTSTYKMHAHPLDVTEKRMLDTVKEFKVVAERNLEDLRKFREKLQNKNYLRGNTYNRITRVKFGDSSKKINNSDKFSLVVTSPPYGDNHTTVTYGQHSFLPLQWINLKDINTKLDTSCLNTAQEIDRRSLGGKKLQLSKSQLNKLFSLSPTLDCYFKNVPEGDMKKVEKVVYFMNDLTRTIDNIINVLNQNAYLIWTIGNRYVNNTEIQNDLILTEILKSKGLNLIVDFERDILNKRMPKRNRQSKTMNKEKILIFRKPF